jgi:1-hydroxycarotenoid 3,4-desaturase
MRETKVVVIGAGMGGLSAAIELALAGCTVTVVERAARPGGKMRETLIHGAAVDSGPTVFTMPWVFQALFERAGARFEDYVRLKPLDILARHAWSADQRLDLFADQTQSTDAIGAFAGAREARGYQSFCAEAKRVFDTLRDTFMTAEKTDPLSLTLRIGLHRMGALFGIRPFDTLWSALSAHFQDPRLRQLFGRYATYCGSSPFAAPATLMLIAHVEQAGVWQVEGGMQRLADALERLALSLGVAFRYEAHADEIMVERGRTSGVVLASGERLPADCIVVNADAQALAAGAFGPAVASALDLRPRKARSLSAVTWAMTAQPKGFELAHHNVFFSDAYAAEFDDIFQLGRLPGHPTLYVCAQDRAGPDLVGCNGAERLLILANAPACGDESDFNESELDAWETAVFQHFQTCGLTLQADSESCVRTTPFQFNARFPATGGALYGPATHGWAAAFNRPGAATRIRGLYLAGGGAHPGAGVPMAALSGQLAARRLIRDQALIRSFHPAAMLGGMSTPSATTSGSA